ncbi:MAG: VTT domain-containing protein [Actinobacteria bacterium]|nr:VTT domain-containing protein [Actinomycetota bacterium]
MSSVMVAALGIDPQGLLTFFGTFATIALFLIIFAESGLLIGFFLPGDSLLFTAGLLSAVTPNDQFNIQFPAPIWVIIPGCFIAAVLGDQVGYGFGKKVGPSIFKRPDSRLFKHENVEKAEAFFERHGSKTIILARFVPIVRTFAPIVAGVGKMEYRTFVTYNVVGAGLWAIGVTLLGYLLGQKFPGLGEKLDIVIPVIIVLSLVPIGIEYLRHRNQQKAAIEPADEAH